ncbi:hypothetical protein OIE63_11080 [Streptomyces sp. NBC_01795]|uniref:hypothetical protein n=1 Tax=Streptomyces sp. NBC_01795 TaxID=2975943 RepID=UPI002DDC233A|nr:hypothetical protein [Streptomyces sp. NBC_01795]WSA92051.1 hypothetical protein OIE63_11080 [Streptomyces sp. NBC_01795]
MPLTPSPAAARPRRRSLLTGGLGAVGAGAVLTTGLVSGCSGDSGQDAADPERSDAARRLRARGARDSERLAARYDGTIKVHPALAERLRPLREEVARHAQALRGSGTGTGSPSPSPSGTQARPSPSSGSPGAGSPERPGGQDGPAQTPSRTPSPDTSGVPDSRKEALAALAGAERKLAGARAKALVTAPPELARLLASVAACGGAHVYLLEEGGGSEDDGADGAPE